jgi:hypothetical protein
MKNEEIREFNEQTRKDHYYMGADDDCYYFVEFIKGAGYGPPGNSFINNLKKKPSKHGTYEWGHKLRAIDDAAETLRRELSKDWIENSTFVPIPPSKAKDHPEYDDRMSQVLNRLGQNVDVRELVYQKKSMDETHTLLARHSIEALAENYEIDEDEVRPKPKHIVIVDDVVTAGKHFRAMCKVLEERFPGVPVSGVFLARRVIPDENK